MDIGCGMELQFSEASSLSEPDFAGSGSGLTVNLESASDDVRHLLDSVASSCTSTACRGHYQSDRHLSASEYKLDLGPANDLVSAAELSMENSVTDISESIISEECSDGYSIVNAALEGNVATLKPQVAAPSTVNLSGIPLTAVLSGIQAIPVIPITNLQNVQLVSDGKLVKVDELQLLPNTDKTQNDSKNHGPNIDQSAVILGNVVMLNPVTGQYLNAEHKKTTVETPESENPRVCYQVVETGHLGSSKVSLASKNLPRRDANNSSTSKPENSQLSLSACSKGSNSESVSDTSITSINNKNTAQSVKIDKPSSTQIYVPNKAMDSSIQNAMTLRKSNAESAKQSETNERPNDPLERTKIVTCGKTIYLTFDCKGQSGIYQKQSDCDSNSNAASALGEKVSVDISSATKTNRTFDELNTVIDKSSAVTNSVSSASEYAKEVQSVMLNKPTVIQNPPNITNSFREHVSFPLSSNSITTSTASVDNSLSPSWTNISTTIPQQINIMHSKSSAVLALAGLVNNSTTVSSDITRLDDIHARTCKVNPTISSYVINPVTVSGSKMPAAPSTVPAPSSVLNSPVVSSSTLVMNSSTVISSTHVNKNTVPVNSVSSAVPESTEKRDIPTVPVFSSHLVIPPAASCLMNQATFSVASNIPNQYQSLNCPEVSLKSNPSRTAVSSTVSQTTGPIPVVLVNPQINPMSPVTVNPSVIPVSTVLRNPQTISLSSNVGMYPPTILSSSTLIQPTIPVSTFVMNPQMGPLSTGLLNPLKVPISNSIVTTQTTVSSTVIMSSSRVPMSSTLLTAVPVSSNVNINSPAVPISSDFIMNPQATLALSNCIMSSQTIPVSSNLVMDLSEVPVSSHVDSPAVPKSSDFVMNLQAALASSNRIMSSQTGPVSSSLVMDLSEVPVSSNVMTQSKFPVSSNFIMNPQVVPVISSNVLMNQLAVSVPSNIATNPLIVPVSPNLRVNLPGIPVSSNVAMNSPTVPVSSKLVMNQAFPVSSNVIMNPPSVLVTSDSSAVLPNITVSQTSNLVMNPNLDSASTNVVNPTYTGVINCGTVQLSAAIGNHPISTTSVSSYTGVMNSGTIQLSAAIGNHPVSTTPVSSYTVPVSADPRDVLIIPVSAMNKVQPTVSLSNTASMSSTPYVSVDIRQPTSAQQTSNQSKVAVSTNLLYQPLVTLSDIKHGLAVPVSTVCTSSLAVSTSLNSVNSLKTTTTTTSSLTAPQIANINCRTSLNSTTELLAKSHPLYGSVNEKNQATVLTSKPLQAQWAIAPQKNISNRAVVYVDQSKISSNTNQDNLAIVCSSDIEEGCHASQGEVNQYSISAPINVLVQPSVLENSIQGKINSTNQLVPKSVEGSEIKNTESGNSILPQTDRSKYVSILGNVKKQKLNTELEHMKLPVTLNVKKISHKPRYIGNQNKLNVEKLQNNDVIQSNESVDNKNIKLLSTSLLHQLPSAAGKSPGHQKLNRPSLVILDDCKPYKCDLCSAAFNRLGNYTRHRMIHKINTKGSYRYKCEECGRLFLQRCDMKRHMLIHTKEEPHRCQDCGKGYIRRSDLVVHMRFHRKERAFTCQHCSKEFFQSGDLNRHIRHVHLRSTLLTCGHCSRQFAKESTLIRHMQTKHRDIIIKSLKKKTVPNDSDSVQGDSVKCDVMDCDELKPEIITDVNHQTNTDYLDQNVNSKIEDKEDDT